MKNLIRSNHWINRKIMINRLFLVILFQLLFSPIVLSQEPVTIHFVFSEGDPPVTYGEPLESNPLRIAKGILPELVTEVFTQTEEYQYSMQAYPWLRAKKLVQSNLKDALCTYPSDVLQKHILFTAEPIYLSDFGFLIYNKTNPKAAGLKDIQNMGDLGSFMFVAERGSNWEKDNVPSYIPRVFALTPYRIFHYVFGRNHGEFFIRNLEEARYIAKKLGYHKKLGFKKVDFIPDSTIPFHIGVRRTHPDAAHIIETIEAIQRLPSFRKKSEEILNKYRY